MKMKKPEDFLKELWIEFHGDPKVFDYELLTLKKSEWDKDFETLMRNRLIMGAFRYGKMASVDKRNYNFAKGAMEDIEEYFKTKNLECLVDAANMLMLAFVLGVKTGEKIVCEDDTKHYQEEQK